MLVSAMMATIGALIVTSRALSTAVSAGGYRGLSVGLQVCACEG